MQAGVVRRGRRAGQAADSCPELLRAGVRRRVLALHRRQDAREGQRRSPAEAAPRAQEYLKSYVFAKDEAEAAEARASRGGLVDAVLLRRRKTDDDHMAVGATCSSKQTDRWKAKAGKVLSQLLTRLLPCACNPAAAA